METSFRSSRTRSTRAALLRPFRPKATFSKTDRWGKSAASCGTYPTFLDSAPTKTFLEATSFPEIEISPESGSSKPAINLRSVVLPDPEDPSTATNSPSVTSNERSLRTRCLLKDFEMFESASFTRHAPNRLLAQDLF